MVVFRVRISMHVRHLWQKWRDDRKASVMVEFIIFGLVAILCLLLLLETFYCYAIKADLDRQLKRIVRQTRTGNFQLITSDGADTLSQQKFKEAMCKAVLLNASNCQNNLTIQRQVVSVGTNPADFKAASCEDDGLKNRYASVSSGDMVVYSACYKWRYITPLSILVNAAGGGSAADSYYTHAVAVWRKE
jgi:Flp pilus assembly protein TadG